MFAVQAQGQEDPHRRRPRATATSCIRCSAPSSSITACNAAICTPGFLMLAANALEQHPDIGDEDLLDVLSSNLCRCTGYQNIIKAVRAAAERDARRCKRIDDAHALTGQYPIAPPDAERSERRARPCRCTRLEDLPLVTGRGRFAGDIYFPHQLHMRIVRSTYRARHASCRSTRRRRWRMPGVHRGVDQLPTSPTFRRSISAPTRSPRPEAYRQPALARDLRALCRRSGRGGVRRGSLSRRGCGRAGRRSRSKNCRRPVGRATTPGEFEPGRSSEAAIVRHRLRRHRRRFPQRARHRRARSRRSAGIPACRWRPAAPSARYDAAARPARAARRRENAASQSRDAVPHARSQPVVAASARRPCRRRLRHPRRALSRGRAGAGRRACASAGR